jgi:hypothetical protein
MIKRAVILSLLAVGLAYGQSGVFNMPFKPFPRVLIPHVEAPAVLVSSNGTITANPYRTLKYCDFVLKAVDQSGADFEGAPLRYIYASADVLSHPNFDTNATVFFQDGLASWPSNVMRKTPVILNTGNPDPFETIAVRSDLGRYFYKATREDLQLASSLTGINTNFPVFCTASFSINEEGSIYGKNTNGLWGEWYYSEYSTNSIMESYGSSSQFADGAYWYAAMRGSVQAASDNGGVAIEVYPSRLAGSGTWMKEGNRNIKWMCTLSNGIDFYRDQAGNLIWFNVEVEWVDKIPAAGSLVQ